jgi:ABC-2 type transport system permease protein
MTIPLTDRPGRSGTARLIAGEFHKTFTNRSWIWLLGASMAITALYASLTIAFGDTPGSFTAPMSSAQGQRTLMSVAAGAAPFAAVLGVLGVTGEYRHRTVTATFLATPRRGRVVLAKLVAHAAIGAGYALVCSALTLAITLPWLAGKNIDLAVGAGEVTATCAGAVIAVAVFGLIGVGLGALLREQVAAVVTVLVYLFIIENILTNIPALDRWTPYLPGQTEEALVGSTLTDRQLLQPWQGGILLASYGIALAGAGALIASRRDIT